MKKAKISIIAAIAKSNRGIGKNNKLLWHIKNDFLHFKKITSGHPVIMGYNTYLSIGKILPGRLNIVLVKDDIKIPGVSVCHTINKAISVANHEDKQEIFFIGGGSVYAQAIKFADKLYLTIVDGKYEADVFFPDYSDFTIASQSDMFQDGNIKYRFIELERKEIDGIKY